MIESKLAALLWTLWIIYWRQTLSNRVEKIYEQVRCFVPSPPLTCSSACPVKG